jgi:hypothetical protein
VPGGNLLELLQRSRHAGDVDRGKGLGESVQLQPPLTEGGQAAIDHRLDAIRFRFRLRLRLRFRLGGEDGGEGRGEAIVGIGGPGPSWPAAMGPGPSSAT